MHLPTDHEQRFQLNNEVHARPPESLIAPVRISFLAMFAAGDRGEDRRHVRDLAEQHGLTPPGDGDVHYSADFGRFRLKWERHTEFSRIKVIVPGPSETDLFRVPAALAISEEWLSGFPGRLMTATHVEIRPKPKKLPDPEALSAQSFGGHPLIGSEIAGGLGTAYTDLRIHADGFSRLLIDDGGMTPRQLGRSVQRILEIDTYRMMALLAFPVARAFGPKLTSQERELAQIMSAMASEMAAEEPKLLDRLTRLQAAIESGYAESDYRFSASKAYYELVQRRTEELRENRLEGLQTFQEFTERRLMPAMNTCAAVARRQEALSSRVARATQLLSTRVEVARTQQNQQVLATMARRAQLQLRLQQTVEGLSVAAVTYYVVGLVSYVAKAVSEVGVPVSPAIVVALSVPIVAGSVWYGVKRVRQRLEAADDDDA
ncbi:MAG: DUF3422 domain-containing protein [Pseudomonadota bacterium]